MKTNKDELIQEFLSSPCYVGETIEANSNDAIPNHFASDKVYTYKIVGIRNDSVIAKIDEYGYKGVYEIPNDKIIRNTRNIGYNPINEDSYKLENLNFDIGCFLNYCGYDRRNNRSFKTEKYGDVEYKYLNWNPHVLDKDNNKVYYQRDFCWSLEDKQLLIESIYNNISLGTVIIRERDFNYVENEYKNGCLEAGFYDIVDGKQRLNAIFEFVSDKFPDSKGYYFSDFSENSKWKFFKKQLLLSKKLRSNSTDKDVINCFLKTNFTGVQMSKEHIEYVKSINI